jgi:ParB-like chromosome segregation protein Spo0J
MKVDKSRWKFVRLKIDSLTPYPAQEAIYGGTTTAVEDEAFAVDVNERGQLDPAHILPFPNAAGLPKNTILDGWRRGMARKAKGQTHLECYLRGDLADATRAEVDAEFVQYNFSRRQLSALARARCAKYLLTALLGIRGRLSSREMEKLKKVIGERLGVGLRTVNRNLAILDGPLEVQTAYDRGEISQVEAAKIGTLCSRCYGKLTRRQQKELGSRIAAGESAATVVREYIEVCEGPTKAAKTKAAAGNSLIRFKELIRELDKSGSAIDPLVLAASAKTLKQGKEVIERLLARL